MYCSTNARPDEAPHVFPLEEDDEVWCLQKQSLVWP